VALWRDMGFGNTWPGASTARDEALACGVPGFVYWHGLGGGGCYQAVDRVCGDRRHHFSRAGGTVIHGWRFILLLGKNEI